MIIQLKSSLHKENVDPSPLLPSYLSSNDQVVEVMTGGTEGIFVEKIQAGEIDLAKPIYLVASGQSNSLAASLEILAYINQHGGCGKIVESLDLKVQS